MRNKTILLSLTALLILFSGFYAYATLGEGRRKSAKRKTQLNLSSRIEQVPGTFSLKSGYDFRGRSVLQDNSKAIQVNTVVSLQKGNHIYTMPLKKQIWTPTVKLTLGNQSIRRF
ncbi:MAG: hypothetical protein FJX92_06745 [Bacteroidetes bacterium]|nr:hypothetical protein [Bacteroidota bacterium]